MGRLTRILIELDMAADAEPDAELVVPPEKDAPGWTQKTSTVKSICSWM